MGRAWRRLRGDGRFVGTVGVVAAAAVLFRVYLLLARTNPTNADGAANAVQAWDMLHGNLMLHGWTVSDVPFWSTELPQYALIELLAGYGPDVPHLAAALTYTLLVLLAAAVAKGNATGRAAAVRVAITVAVLLAPAPGTGYAIVLLIPDHTGTAVPLLLAWLLLSRATTGTRGAAGRSRGWEPGRVPGSRTALVVALILAWTQIGDPLALFVGAVPLTLVSLFRLLTGGPSEHPAALDPAPPGSPAEALDPVTAVNRDPTVPTASTDPTTAGTDPAAATAGTDPAVATTSADPALATTASADPATVASARSDLALSGVGSAPDPAGARRRVDWRGLDARLALAGVGSVVLAQAVLIAVHAAGGFSAHPPIAKFAAPSALAENFRITGKTLAVNFGAYLPDYRTSFPDYQTGFGTLVWFGHLMALLFVGAAVVVAVGRLLTGRESDRTTGILAVAVVVNLGAFIVSTQPAGLDTARQIVPVLPLGAALAGRLFGDAVQRARKASVVVPFAGVLAAALVLQAATARPTPADARDVSRWLVTQGLRSGLGGYWGSHTITVNTGGRVHVAPTYGVQQIVGYRWESRADWYDPARNDARFIVFDHRRPFYGDETAALAQFGRPARTKDFGDFAVWVYDRNLLIGLAAYCVPEMTASMADCPPLAPRLPGAGIFDDKSVR